MVSIAELPDAAPHSETVSQGYELVGVEQTVVCGLDADSRNGPIGFAACARAPPRVATVARASAGSRHGGRAPGPPARNVDARSSRTRHNRGSPERRERRGAHQTLTRRRVPANRSPPGDACPRDGTHPLRHRKPWPVGGHCERSLASRERHRRPSATRVRGVARPAIGVRSKWPPWTRVAGAPHAGFGRAGRSRHR